MLGGKDKAQLGMAQDRPQRLRPYHQFNAEPVNILIATISRWRETRKSMPRMMSSPDAAAIEINTAAAYCAVEAFDLEELDVRIFGLRQGQDAEVADVARRRVGASQGGRLAKHSGSREDDRGD